MAVTIFIEGKADKRFLEDFIKFHFSQNQFDAVSFVIVGGKDGLHLSKNAFVKNTDQAGINLVIFDADSNFDERIKELQQQKMDLAIDFDLFLFPNNKNSGDLETLLLELTVTEHQGIFGCFKPFNDCLLSKNSNYNVPSLKTQIYSYLDFQNIQPSERDRDYLNSSWNLDVDFSKPLLEFLKKYLG